MKMSIAQKDIQYHKIGKRIILLYGLLAISSITFCQEVYRYMSSADHIDLNSWIPEQKRSFDQEGILMQNKEYHALTIAGFGILSYEDFIASGDSASFRYIINQYKYFCDSARIDYIDDFKGMGLPYKFKFYDLKPPWYSGMTQGVAVSFMLRYYKLTGDAEALKKAKQLVYFMLRPEEKGGAIGKTPEGYTFIEEYPNSKTNPQVLNGFINGLIGLREYLNFFPNDTLAQRIHDESYQSMIKTFREYDLPDWTSYNRSKKKVSNLYMRYQITELEFLNFIYSDFRLVKQMMIWSYFAYNKFDKETKYYKNPHYQYAVPLQKNQDKLSIENVDYEKTLKSVNSYSVSRKSKKSSNQLRHKKTYSLHLNDSVYAFQLHFNQNIDNSQWNFKIRNISSDSLAFLIDSSKMIISGKEKFNQLEISYFNKQVKKLNISDLQVYNRYQFQIPRFGFYMFETIPQLQADSLYQIHCDGEYLKETVVFYRFAPNLPALKTAKYEIKNTISLAHPYFVPTQSGYYQFFMSTPMIKGYWISNPEIRKVENVLAD
jgi:heparosan-N-sulfate-glucuronate 5-epimerase